MAKTVGLYVIYDKVAEEAGPVFEAVNDSVAIRQTCNIIESANVAFIDDFILYCLGSINKKTMLMHRFENPEQIDYEITLLSRRKGKIVELGHMEEDND